MNYHGILKPHKGMLCKLLPIQSLGMWELVVPCDEAEHNARLDQIGTDCVVVVRDVPGPTQGLREVVPMARLATFIPANSTGQARGVKRGRK